MHPLPTFLAAFCAATILCDHCAQAEEIILAGFVDAGRVESPDMIDVPVGTGGCS